MSGRLETIEVQITHQQLRSIINELANFNVCMERFYDPNSYPGDEIAMSISSKEAIILKAVVDAQKTIVAQNMANTEDETLQRIYSNAMNDLHSIKIESDVF
ncbi:hypothetical protein SDC9_75564 [bioreactor metagenome]|uniref:Uncharacterized protein n=1 Tax=bioreactor metagenome TaxID=1076179 RepID=A0A644YKK4_9ZZZZ